MKSSDISSTTTPECPPSDTPQRNAFALRGPSVTLDPLSFAVRADLADIRLADRVFAPHYAEPMPMIAAVKTPILDSAKADATALSALDIGDRFDVLEVTTSFCWGQQANGGMVGYVARNGLRRPSGDAV